MRTARGFTMVELIVVMMVISVGLLGIARLFGTAVRGLNTTQDLQEAGEHAQACAEEVLAYHHKTNLAGLANASLPTLCTRTLSSFNRTLTLGNAYSNDATRPQCPANVTCRDVKVLVSSKTTPAIQSVVDLMMAKY
ncbi:MAG: prepilin-type N-terminal cleavage/methylation domain-containing protein [Limnohabitans sp.]